MNANPGHVFQTELHRVIPRYAHTRVCQPKAVDLLRRSLDRFGQLMPVVTVEDEEGLVLIDGYLRYQALSRLDRDSILVQVYAAGELAALLMLLGHGQGRHWESIEQAFIIREIRAQFSCSLHEIAGHIGRDVSWVHRRLALIESLPPDVLPAVSAGLLSSWAAARIVAPFARANNEHARRLTEHLKTEPLSTRELVEFLRHYRQANGQTRARMIQEPGLFIKSLAARAGQDLEQGPEGAWYKDMGIIIGVLRRLLKLRSTVIYAGQDAAERRRLLEVYWQARSLFRQMEEKMLEVTEE